MIIISLIPNLEILNSIQMIEDHISIFDFDENTIQGAVSTFILTIPYIF